MVELNIDHEIIIVNDGSTDQTGQVAKEIEHNDRNVTLLTNDYPKGMGYGYKIGLEKASKEFYMFSGGDSMQNDQGLTNLLSAAQENDLVLAYLESIQSR